MNTRGASSGDDDVKAEVRPVCQRCGRPVVTLMGHYQTCPPDPTGDAEAEVAAVLVPVLAGQLASLRCRDVHPDRWEDPKYGGLCPACRSWADEISDALVYSVLAPLIAQRGRAARAEALQDAADDQLWWLTEATDGDFLIVDCGHIGHPDGRVGLSDARPTDLTRWVRDRLRARADALLTPYAPIPGALS